jgi:hypothetical protein
MQTCAQVLLTLENLADRSQYVNARNTFTELLAYGTIPVVNENVSAWGRGVTSEASGPGNWHERECEWKGRGPSLGLWDHHVA